MMKKLFAFSALCALTIAFGVLAFGPGAFAGPIKATADFGGVTVLVEVDCYSVGLDLAQQNGGELSKAIPVVENGVSMCKIVILIPGGEGERPRRKEILVQQ